MLFSVANAWKRVIHSYFVREMTACVRAQVCLVCGSEQGFGLRDNDDLWNSTQSECRTLPVLFFGSHLLPLMLTSRSLPVPVLSVSVPTASGGTTSKRCSTSSRTRRSSWTPTATRATASSTSGSAPGPAVKVRSLCAAQQQLNCLCMCG